MANPTLVTLDKPRSSASEAFRTLRTNLMFGHADNPIHTLMLTSAGSGEEKSTALANLAVTFAQSGHRTILVDSDMRNPQQHTIWNVSNDHGLTTMMMDDGAMSTPPLVQTSVDNLSLLPCGPQPQIPADLLSSQRMNEVIGVLKARADYVLFDSPPVLSASDAALLGAKVDGVVLVVRAGHTRRDHVARAKQALEQIYVRLLGAVLTNAPRQGLLG